MCFRYILPVIWIQIAHFLYLTCGREVYYLQTDGIASGDSGLLWTKSVPVTNSVTACARIFLLQTRDKNYVFSYAVNGSPNEFYMDLRYYQQVLRVGCCLDAVYEEFGIDIRVMHWMYVCVDLNLQDRVLQVNVNGHIMTRNLTLSTLALQFKSDGVFMLGQDQDSVGGDTDAVQSFHGYLADIDIHFDQDSNFSSDCYVECCGTQVDGTDICCNKSEHEFSLRQKTQIVELVEGGPCEEREKILVVYNEARNLKEIKTFCSHLGGAVPLPKTSEENVRLYLYGKEHCHLSKLWLRAVFALNDKKWKDFDSGEALTYNAWEHEYHNANSDTYAIVSLHSENPKLNWGVTTSDTKLCSICEFEYLPTFRLLGLDPTTAFDSSYTQFGYRNGKAQFLGTHSSVIYWMPIDNSYGYWQVALQDGSIYANMNTPHPTVYPIGLHDWVMSKQDSVTFHRKRLKFTTCNKDMFTCDDGSCIAASNRCNKKKDCEDFSDEERCDIILQSTKYDKNLPPPAPTQEFPLSLPIDIEINFIHSLDLAQSKLSFDLSLTIYWKDSRLIFKNLQSNYSFNTVESIESLWFPHVNFLGPGNFLINVDLRYAQVNYVLRESSPLPRSDYELDEDLLYSGQDNSLVNRKEWTLELLCYFDLTYFPFDTQRCPMKIAVQGYSAEQFVLKTRQMTSLQKRNHHEYEFLSFNVTDAEVGVQSAQAIMMVFRNRFGYYISAAYVPTSLMLIISYSTFYFDLERFTDRITVSLTSFLVLATIFSQVAASLPKTSYLKLIDTWFLGVINFNFSIVLSLIAIERYRVKATAIGPFLKKKEPEYCWGFKVNYFMVVFYPMLCFVCLVIYIVIIWNNQLSQ
ncbi:hypothetical protein SK128_019901 [Halocaridina rubra]|uniref:Pentraxin (PTX) domain-containing protein n=1 Tax=Halocaridina rubra TaxID=373956 RepID=A0AAN9A9B7_HALRR